jgi:glyoxylase-like metal-dependent hydrolase (beta-lactamase superfamily II)
MSGYTGAVAVGGPAAVRELPRLVISKIAVGPYENNCYLLRCSETGMQAMIDAAAEPHRLLDLIGEGGLAAVITTHAHGDHWQALEDVVRETGAITYAHPDDAGDIPVATDRPVRGGDVIRFGQIDLAVIHLVGHTQGSIALVYDDPDGPPHIFSGDSLFPGGVGNTWSDAARFSRLMDDVTERIFAVYPDETWVYPGHGADTWLGRERPALPEWRERGW